MFTEEERAIGDSWYDFISHAQVSLNWIRWRTRHYLAYCVNITWLVCCGNPEEVVILPHRLSLLIFCWCYQLCAIFSNLHLYLIIFIPHLTCIKLEIWTFMSSNVLHICLQTFYSIKMPFCFKVILSLNHKATLFSVTPEEEVDGKGLIMFAAASCSGKSPFVTVPSSETSPSPPPPTPVVWFNYGQ